MSSFLSPIGALFNAQGCVVLFRKVEQPSLLDVLDRILDKGIVVDAWIRFSLVGLDLLTMEARIVVASIETYLEYASEFRDFQIKSRPTCGFLIMPAKANE